jgi:hypothetical protein
MAAPSPRTGYLLFGAAATAGAVLAANFALGAQCSFDTSYCAHAGPPAEWRGKVIAPDGRPVAHAKVEYTFESNRPRGRAVSVTTDELGRYCLIWPRESVTAYFSSRAGRVVSPDARLGGPARPDEASGTQAATQPWDPAVDGAAACVRASPPWYRVDDLTSNWRYRAIDYGALVALGLAAAALLARPRRRALAVAAAGLAAADAILFLLVWAVKWL